MSGALILRFANPGRYAFKVLAGALEIVEDEGGIDVIAASTFDELVAATRSSLAAGKATCAAWSFYSASLSAAADEAARLRTLVPSGFSSLAGGVHATAEPLETLRAGFDRVAIGEGEHVVRDVARALRDRGSIDDVRGIARLERGELVTNGRGALVEPLDDFPAFSSRRRWFGSIEITRGCIYACRFCQTPFVSKARFRHRSIANVGYFAAEIARANLRDVRFISPTSLSYGTDGEEPDLDAVEALLAAVRAAIGPQRKLFFGTFPSEVRPEHVTPRALAVLKRWVDNDNLVIGGQSGSERVLMKSHRGHDVAAIERAVHVALEAGFRPNVDFLLGLPGEEPEDALATVEFVEKLTSLGARAHAHTFLPLPGTPFRNAPAGRIDERVRARLAALEGAHRLYGAWRSQERLAREIASRRA